MAELLEKARVEMSADLPRMGGPLCRFCDDPAYATGIWKQVDFTVELRLCVQHLQEAVQRYGPASAVSYYPPSSDEGEA